MYAVAKFSVAILAAGAFGLSMPAQAAADNAKPAAAMFYPLVGHWKGKGQLGEPGKEPAKLALTLSCSQAASGWAVRCDMTAKNNKMEMSESDLMGVDPITGQAHWYAITDQGDAHDHLVKWTDGDNMAANYSWKQDGKQMTENITMKLTGKKTMEFSSTVSADGKEVNVFSGKLTR